MARESFYTKLKDILGREDNNLNQDGSLNRGKIENDALKYDDKLIRLLLSETATKEQFFKEVSSTDINPIEAQKTFIFKQQDFLDYIRDKNILNASYTKYRNKIGLASNGDFIKASQNVVIDFPFKDCILEGGESKAEGKRSEIMFNSVLAKDEIDKLLDKKVLTNVIRISSKGEEKISTQTLKESLKIGGGGGS